jgi:hypothetical protein
MLLPPLQSAKRKSAAVMFSERLRVRAEIAGTDHRNTTDHGPSRALLAEADAIFAREKLPLVAPEILAGQGTTS